MVGGRRILRVLSVFAVALAAGHLVETMRASAITRELGAAFSEQIAAQGAGKTAQQGGSLPRSASLSADIAGDLPPLQGITAVSAATEPRTDGSCAPAMALAVADGAMIDLTLDAPCNARQRVLLRHAGLSFTARTDADGHLVLRLPALETKALVAAYFESSEIALAGIDIPAAATFTRFAFEAPHPIHFDLRVDEAGQVYSGRSGLAGPDGNRKILTLGIGTVSEPIIAQVYTFPANNLDAAKVTVELRVTPESCGGSFRVETVLSQRGTATRGELPLAMPLCGTSGDILVLKNLVAPLTLAVSN